jgi:hypothetical protein
MRRVAALSARARAMLPLAALIAAALVESAGRRWA